MRPPMPSREPSAATSRASEGGGSGGGGGAATASSIYPCLFHTNAVRVSSAVTVVAPLRLLPRSSQSPAADSGSAVP